MPSHWEAIGVAPSDLDAFGPWLSGVYEVASAAGRIEHGHGATAVADDPSGARITIHVGDDGAIRCAKPGFAGAATFRWRPERVAPDDDCPLCDVVMADLVDEDGELVYPFALSVETIGETRALIPLGDEGDVSFAALGETGEVWRDETAFEASHEPPGETGAPVFGGFASRSLIPSGTFVFEPGQAVTSHVLAHGVVDTAERRRNELGGGSSGRSGSRPWEGPSTSARRRGRSSTRSCSLRAPRSAARSGSSGFPSRFVQSLARCRCSPASRRPHRAGRKAPAPARRVAGPGLAAGLTAVQRCVTNARWLTAIALASVLAQATALAAVLWRR